MAIYHFSAQVISRGKGQSAVASASYRSGERLTDERTGEMKYYVREVQPDTMILAPSNSPEWVQDRNRLWNEVEQSETRVNSRLAREINIALPVELNHDQQKELIRDYVQKEFVDKGMIADIAIHRDDKENPHAHVMLTTREITADGFGPKNRDWNKKELLEQWREEWANHANKALEKEGIQERISHLSHEARGLEQLPTVHLGHVAHEMEKRGVQTEKGNLNRDRQEYNALVVDLQKYREEKKALEQEKARQQEQKQKAEKFSTAAERADLQNASKILKAEPTMTNIVKRREQLDKWEERANNGDQYIRWKDDKIREASDHFRWTNTFHKQMEEAQQRIDNLNWFNPLKLKSNQRIKEQAENDISNAQDQIKFHDDKLKYHREKLGFTTEKEFNQVKTQHEIERPGLLEKNRNARQTITSERNVLQKVENAHKNAFVRQVASLYPERPEMRHMSHQTASRVDQVNKLYGNGKRVPIENIEKAVRHQKQEIQRLQGEISRVEQTKGRLQRAKGYLENYEKNQAIVEKYENNPFLKGKMLVSKSTKQEYDRAVTARDSYKNYMEKESVSGRADFEKQVKTFDKMEAKVPEYQGAIQSQGKGLGLLDAVLQGLQQASREMTRERERQQQKTKSKGKSRQQTWGRDSR
ncbi:MobA/MobL family protein (plasmid) [Sutcliffiella horikoshii]|uniref:MobQ family relaxase n=1 Tax=Sutcliffiella horikoshii TaxID=79883 RepID=UPI001CBF7D60|nr:MobQ family relaxase [Sutcliffiella horikoshii]UAL49708.1 MobA/MobL family protein [Sutcliffiella horikoshii]